MNKSSSLGSVSFETGVRNGIASTIFQESTEGFDAFIRALREEYRPLTSLSKLLVDMMVVAVRRLKSVFESESKVPFGDTEWIRLYNVAHRDYWKVYNILEKLGPMHLRRGYPPSPYQSQPKANHVAASTTSTAANLQNAQTMFQQTTGSNMSKTLSSGSMKQFRKDQREESRKRAGLAKLSQMLDPISSPFSGNAASNRLAGFGNNNADLLAISVGVSPITRSSKEPEKVDQLGSPVVESNLAERGKSQTVEPSIV